MDVSRRMNGMHGIEFKNSENNKSLLPWRNSLAFKTSHMHRLPKLAVVP